MESGNGKNGERGETKAAVDEVQSWIDPQTRLKNSSTKTRRSSWLMEMHGMATDEGKQLRLSVCQNFRRLSNRIQLEFKWDFKISKEL